MTTETPLEEFAPARAPFGGKKRLYNVVPVQFRTNFLKREFDARELQLQPGDDVIVESGKGPVIATVTGHVTRKVLAADGIQRILRRANAHDQKQAESNEEREREAYRFCIERIRARNLPMKLIRANYMHDGSRVVFYFSADGRIDFRDLVKDLAHRFRTRIEMHQIGVRDGTRMLGGIGPCGRELCCSTFLENFAPVSIRMAKDQGLTLNPKKVSGMCGRLMCCLVYEQQLYRKMKKRLPRTGKQVMTELGGGKVLDVDILTRRVNVELEDGNRKLFPMDDVVFGSGGASPTVDRGVAPVDYVWPDGEPERNRGGSGRKKSRRRRRGSKKKTNEGNGGETP